MQQVTVDAQGYIHFAGTADFSPVRIFTFNPVMGIYDFNFVMYLRMDASDATISGFEGGIYAPNQRKRLPSAEIVLSPQSPALGEGDPFNVMGAAPGEDEYSPIWDITPVVWTDAAINAGKRQRLRQDDEARVARSTATSASNRWVLCRTARSCCV